MDRTTDKEIKAGAAPVSFNEVEKLTEAKYTIQKYKRILFYVVICVLLAAFILGQYIYPSEREPVTEESITYTGTFYRVLEDGTEEELRIPGRYNVPAGESLVIRSVLPQDYHENTIAIRSSLENVRIYIGGELRAVYDTENTRPFGKNSASRYVVLRDIRRGCGTGSADRAAMLYEKVFRCCQQGILRG